MREIRGEEEFVLPPAPIAEVVEELGHKGRNIDLLVIDCDGCDLDQHRLWFHKDLSARQLLIRMRWPHDVAGSNHSVEDME